MRIFISVILLLLQAPAWASISGQLKSTTDDFPYRYGPPTQTLLPYVSLELHDKIKIRRNWRAQWKLYGITNTASKYSPEKLYGDIPEALIETKNGLAKARFGINTVNWGIVDVSSPSDVVNTQAIFNPLRATKQGAPMVDVTYGPQTFVIEGLYIPVQRQTTLPSKDSRWLPRDGLVNIDLPQGLGNLAYPKMLEYEYDRPVTEDRALNNNYGAKLSSHLGSWGFQVMHYEGVAPSPKVRPNNLTISGSGSPPVFTVQNPVHLTQINYRQRTTAFGFVWAREKWIYRGETAYSHTISHDDFLSPWSWTSVLAIETNVELPSSTMTVLAQGYYTKNPQAADNLIASSYRIFDRTGVLGMRWAYSETLTVMLSGLWETQTNGIFAMASFDQTLNDHLKWGLSWRNFSAAEDGLLKTYSKDSHGTLELTYFF